MTALQQIKERPILFSGPMVRAILEGRKTQTRRIAKSFNLPEFDTNAVHKIGRGEFIGWRGEIIPDPYFTIRHYPPGVGIKCKYGKPGDRLWVRESWRWFDAMTESDQDGVYSGYQYRASTNNDELKWKPSIHMPRAASRILLEITDIRVERLQDIIEQDAIAEGIEGRYHPEDPTLWTWRDYGSKERFSYGTAIHPKSVFRKLWQSINGPESWEQNPWVWVIEFKKL